MPATTTTGTPPDLTTITVKAADVQPGDLIDGRRVSKVFTKPQSTTVRYHSPAGKPAPGNAMAPLTFKCHLATIKFEDCGPALYRWLTRPVDVQRPGAAAEPAAAAKPAPKTRAGKSPEARIALDLIRQQPGITIPELANTMGIPQNGLYRVLPALADDGKITKTGRGWHILDQAETQAA